MEKEKKVKKSGYAYLRAKLSKADQELADYKLKYVKLLDDFKRAKDQLEKEKNNRDQLVKMFDKAVKRMGPIRRLIFGY